MPYRLQIILNYVSFDSPSKTLQENALLVVLICWPDTQLEPEIGASAKNSCFSIILTYFSPTL